MGHEVSWFVGDVAGMRLGCGGESSSQLVRGLVSSLGMKQDRIIAGRYKLVKKLGSGFAAEAYRVQDTQSGRDLVLKLHRPESPFPPEYARHLLHLQQALSSVRIPHLLQPLDAGWEEGRFWEVVEYVDGGTVGNLISASGPLGPVRALDILEQIATALAQLHERNIVHADVKPSNILIERSTGEPRLIDFGLMQPVGEANDVIIVGTYRYLHPDLRRNVKGSQESESSTIRLSGSIGTYSDIYALGVVALEMLTGETNQPHLLSIDRVAALLTSKNPSIRNCNRAIVESLAKLLCSMLGVSSSGSGITALEIAATARTLREVFPTHETGALQQAEISRPLEPTEDKTNSEVAALNAAVESLRTVAESLVESTAAMLRTAEHLEEIGSSDDDSASLSDIKQAFENASVRVRASWRLGIAMTLFAFVLTVTMIVCAVVFGIKTGTSGWTLVFGGVSAATVLGTLLWRPYDRAFRATILAGQIEMIHVQTVATFRGTTDLNKRIEICREAISSLRTALETHAIAGDGESKKRIGRTAKKANKQIH